MARGGVAGDQDSSGAPPVIAALALSAMLLAAGPPPGPGTRPGESCDHCGMLIEQPRFVGRATSLDGRVFCFDAVECLAAFTIGPPADALGPFTLRVARWDRADSLLDVRRAWYLRSDRLPSPMGLGVSAYRSPREAAAAARRHGGKVLDWDGVVAMVRERWFQPARR